MDPYADIDLDSESVWLDGAWYTREELARHIKEMIEAGDFRVSRPSQALDGEAFAKRSLARISHPTHSFLRVSLIAIEIRETDAQSRSGGCPVGSLMCFG